MHSLISFINDIVKALFYVKLNKYLFFKTKKMNNVLLTKCMLNYLSKTFDRLVIHKNNFKLL